MFLLGGNLPRIEGHHVFIKHCRLFCVRIASLRRFCGGNEGLIAHFWLLVLLLALLRKILRLPCNLLKELSRDGIYTDLKFIQTNKKKLVLLCLLKVVLDRNSFFEAFKIPNFHQHSSPKQLCTLKTSTKTRKSWQILRCLTEICPKIATKRITRHKECINKFADILPAHISPKRTKALPQPRARHCPAILPVICRKCWLEG